MNKRSPRAGRITKHVEGQTMGSICRLVSVAILGTAVIAAVGTSPPAAAVAGWGLNGTYTATSNGEWAKTNDIFRDEASIRSIWTIDTTCSYPTECTGTVVSDWGWSAPIYQTAGVWFVKHIVEKWQPCPDGTAAPGFQIFRFFAATADGDAADPGSSILVGADQTTGTSGSCGSSKTLFISMPFKLIKTG